MRRFRRGAVALVALSLLVAACGDDDDGAVQAEEPGEQSADGVPADVAGAEGDPVKIMQILESGGATGITYTSYTDGLEIRVDRLNADGGLAGRPVEVEVCETKLDPNIAAECAQRAATDEAFVAVVGSVSQFSEVIVPILEDGQIPYVGNFPFTPTDGTSEIAFPAHGGSAVSLAGIVRYAIDELGAETIAVGQLGVPGGDPAFQYITTLAEAGGASASRVVIPPDRQDLSADVATLATQGDVIVPATSAEQTQALVSGAAQQGIDVPVVPTFAGLPPRLIEALGDAAEGVQLTALFNPDSESEGAQQLLDDAEAAGTDVQFPDDELTSGYVAGWLFAEAAERADSPDRQAILAALNSIDSFETGGFTPMLDYTTPSEAMGGAQPRVVNTSVWYAVVEDGVVVPISTEPVDVFGS